MIEGTTIHIKGRNYIVPPLNFAAVRKLEPGIKKLSDPTTKNMEKFEVMMEAIIMALRRNYKCEELPIEEIEDMIDLGNMNQVFNAVMAVSGMVKKEGEVVPGSVQTGD